MSAIDTIRNMASSGQLSASDCMELANSLRWVLEGMQGGKKRDNALDACIEAAYSLMLLARQMEGAV